MLERHELEIVLIVFQGIQRFTFEITVEHYT